MVGDEAFDRFAPGVAIAASLGIEIAGRPFPCNWLLRLGHKHLFARSIRVIGLDKLVVVVVVAVLARHPQLPLIHLRIAPRCCIFVDISFRQHLNVRPDFVRFQERVYSHKLFPPT